MLPSLSSDAMTRAASSATTTLTAGSPLLNIVLCSSLNATAEDRWRAPKSLVRPKLGPSYSTTKMWGTQGTLLAFNTKGVEGLCWSSGIGTRTSDKLYSLSYSILHQNQPSSWLVHIWNTFSVGTSHGQPWTHLTHHGLDSGEATTFPFIVFFVCHSVALASEWHFFLRLPKWSPETVLVWTSRTLGVHNFSFQPPIGMRFEANF